MMLTYCHFLQKDTTDRNDMQIRSRGNKHQMISARYAELSVINLKTNHDYLCLFVVFSKLSNAGYHWCIHVSVKKPKLPCHDTRGIPFDDNESI